MTKGANSIMTDHEAWSLLCSMLVFLMFLGLLMIEAGCVRSKNAASVFLRGLATLTISLVTSWICGFMFAHSSGHYLIGFDSNYSTLHRVPEGVWSQWVMYSLISALASTIVASSMSERTHLTGHLIISCLCSLIIFPVSAHWIWHPEGWLAVRGCTDLGGIITLHVFSGCGSFVGNLLVGPRVERLGENFRSVSLPGHSLPLTAMGAMLVMMGMVGKLAGAAVNDQVGTRGRITVNLLVAGAGGGLVTMMIFKFTRRGRKQFKFGGDGGVKPKDGVFDRKWSFLTAFNGMFTGMICVSGVGAELPSWGAFVAGLIGGLMFFLMSGLLRLNKVDDPTHGIAVHLSGGVVGAIVVGLVNLAETQSGISIGWEIVGMVSVSAWSCGCFLVTLLPLLLCGKLRIKDAQERLGIDAVKIKELAYDFSTPADKPAASRITVPYFSKDNVFLTPNMDRHGANNVSCQLSAINKMSQIHSSRGSDIDLQGVSPKLILQHPSPPGSINQKDIPVPPPYPTSTMKKTSSLNVPELTITSTFISENDSEAPLLNSLSTSITSNKDTISLDMREIKKNLRKQKEQLKKTNSIYVSREDVDELNSSIDSNETTKSVKSSVIRQVVTVAGNKENFSYLTNTNKLQEDNVNATEEVNDTDIDITKFLKSPEPQAQISKKDIKNHIYKDKTEKSEKETKAFESSIDFVSDGDESDFDEKLI